MLLPTAEEKIVGWMNELRRDGVPVSATVLQVKARDLAAVLEIAPELFVASNTWKASFLGHCRTKNRAG